MRSSQDGFSLVEVLVAAGLLATVLVSLAELFALSARANLASRNTTYASILAAQKLEELRSLAWGFDPGGAAVTDTGSDTAVSPVAASGGTGLQPSPPGTLQANTGGWVDYVGRSGSKIGGGAAPPQNAIYTRRWSVEPRAANPDTIVIQVLVTRNRNRGNADQGAVARLPEEARLITAKTRKAQ
jgi:type II secretory pathway pseudopilin PulG